MRIPTREPEIVLDVTTEQQRTRLRILYVHDDHEEDELGYADLDEASTASLVIAAVEGLRR